jgi:hypothetical protein
MNRNVNWHRSKHQRSSSIAAADSRRNYRYYLARGVVIFDITTKYSRKPFSGTLHDISDTGVLVEFNKQFGLLNEDEVDWVCGKHHGVAKVVRHQSHKNSLALTHPGFSELCKALIKSEKLGGFRFMHGEHGLEAYLIGEFDFNLAKQMFKVCQRAKVLNLTGIAHLNTPGLGVILYALDNGVQIKGCNKSVANILDLAGVCLKRCKRCEGQRISLLL